MRFILFLLVTIFFYAELPARENDPFTRRHLYEGKMPDILKVLDLKTNELLQAAVNQYNIDHCENKYNVEKIHRLSAYYIYRFLAAENETPAEPEIPSPITLAYALGKKGLGPLQRWVREEVEKKYVVHITENIYSNVYLLPDRYFETYTVLLNNHYIGPDKVDHFFDQGYTYFLISGYGMDDARAIEHGIDGEYSYFGLRASGVFSFADLKANYDGYVFYKNLFLTHRNNPPLLKINQYGCVEKKHQFSWADEVSWQWDELYNPSFYKEKVKIKVKRNLQENMATHDYCKSYQFALETGAYDKEQNRTREYLHAETPAVENIFKIDYLCSNLQTVTPVQGLQNEKTN